MIKYICFNSGIGQWLGEFDIGYILYKTFFFKDTHINAHMNAADTSTIDISSKNMFSSCHLDSDINNNNIKYDILGLHPFIEYISN